MLEYSFLIPLFPFIAFLFILFFGKRTPGEGAYVALAAVGLSFLTSMVMVATIVFDGHSEVIEGIIWINEGIKFGLLMDQLTAVMLVVVSIVGLLVVVYSIGYMHGDKSLRRYYAEICLFVASMFLLVISSNLLQMFMAWELVGLCSYLLIGFWHEKPEARSAAIKAFLVTRLGDAFFLMGIFLIYVHLGTLNMVEIFERAPLLRTVTFLGVDVATVSTLFLFAGAMGKSAQFPLHIWLPNAMEGPTTVSALIHAATMVKAGIYLVARFFPMFALSTTTMTTVALIGGFTALIAATMAIVMTDIKRIVAYSTISHLGFMTLALGAGGYAAGVFHLLNHSFFKALLFLASGAIIHATHTNDIREMGGLRKKMPLTFMVSFIGAWSLSGFPFLSGFWSKDEILAAVYTTTVLPPTAARVAFLLGMAATLMSGIYIFRWFFVIFFGEEGEKSHHAHEAPRVMTYPLIVLAIGAAASWLVIFGGFEGWISNAL
ncbi:MAG: NADH-quinone oxidoreductase subunit L, partial [Candidatus Hydrothermarchaeaceae archaeon]